LNVLTKNQLRIVRNVIYAWHGYSFRSPDLQSLFAAQKWYKVNPDFAESDLNQQERMNLDIILAEEKHREAIVGAEVDVIPKTEESLMIASTGGYTEIARMLIQAGVDINAQDKDGATPLMKASKEGNTEVVELLMEAGADIHARDKDGATPLMKASGGGNTKVVELLMEAGADINIQDSDGRTALLSAAQFGHKEIVQLLREAGALEYEYRIVAYYPFNGSANDESGNENHGDVFGATLTTDRFGNPNSAYDFNGKNAYITTPLDTNISKMPELTMSVWVYPRRTQYEGVVDHGRRIILSSDDGDFDRSLVLQNGMWEILMGGRDWNLRRVPVDIREWQHVAVVFGASRIKFYINGVLYKNRSFSGSGNTSVPLTIGNNASRKWHQPFDGIIDDVRIYNRILSDYEIHELYSREM
jgi:hypothetical protein